MKIRDIMTTEVKTATPQQSVTEIARMMADADIGAVFVNDNDRLIGVITDRDIAVRGVARGAIDSLTANDVMTETICYCFEDEEVQHVSENMADIEVRRLPVMDRGKRLVGVVSLGNIAAARDRQASSTVLEGVARAH
jgi:CBS domain-containing protein